MEFLLEYSRRVLDSDDASSMAATDPIPSRVEALAVTMFEHGIVGKAYVALTQVGRNVS